MGRAPDGRTGRWRELDGLRGVAIAGVMGCHLQMGSFMQGGFLGVDVFFTLSGFLITSLLIGEMERCGTVGLTRFYVRRGLRLLPALVAVVVVAVLLVTVIDQSSPLRSGTLANVPWALLYGEDWYRSLFHASTLSTGLLGHTWSLSIEEQFYLVWPPVLVALLRRFHHRRTLIALGLVAVGAAEGVCRWLLLDGGWSSAHIFYGVDLHSDGLLFGCGLALLLSRSDARAWLHKRHVILNGAAATAALLVVWLFFVVPADGSGYRLGFPLADLLTCVVIAALVSGPVLCLGRLMNLRPLQWLGQRSYGIYLWHFVVYFGVVNRLDPSPTWTRCVVEIACSLVAGEMSWRLIERKCNALRVRFSPERTAMLSPEMLLARPTI